MTWGSFYIDVRSFINKLNMLKKLKCSHLIIDRKNNIEESVGKVANSLNLDPKALVLSCILIMFLLLCTVPPAWTKETPLDQPMHQLKDGDVEESDADRPLVFLSNKSLPPMVYLQDGKRVGIVVDLGIAIKGHMIRPVDLEYLDWSQAQQFVLEGKADAVLHINPSEKRKKLFDFSDDFLESEFSIFIRHPSKNIYDISDLSGLNVGVLDRGLCFNLLSRDPSINLVGFPDILPGFQSLHDGGLDAVVMDRHVGTFLLAENNIEGIRTTGEPIDRSNAAIAVKKGNTELLVEINKALAEIKTNGT